MRPIAAFAVISIASCTASPVTPEHIPTLHGVWNITLRSTSTEESGKICLAHTRERIQDGFGKGGFRYQGLYSLDLTRLGLDRRTHSDVIRFLNGPRVWGTEASPDTFQISFLSYESLAFVMHGVRREDSLAGIWSCRSCASDGTFAAVLSSDSICPIPQPPPFRRD